MVFSSLVFIMIFLPAVFVGSRITGLARKRWVNVFLLLASLLFYAWGEPVYVLLMLLSISVNYVLGLAMDSAGPGKDGMRRLLLAADIVFNLGLLGYYKYYNFAVDTVNRIFHLEIHARRIPLPIGISFFTFQILSYMIDLYRKRYPAQRNPVSLALYISFFPQLIAGPIVRYADIERQLSERTVSVEKTAEGIRRFIYGLGKKVILANTLAHAADRIFSQPYRSISTPAAWVAAVFYTLQIYYDFSGYSDIAIGLGKMLGFDFLENFRYPYLSFSIREFWRRWHISLGTWFREYLYIPLGGNRKGKARTYLNLVIVFFLTGLWHGASFNFVLWGLYHGLFSILERLGFEKILKKCRPLAWIYTFLAVVLGWVWFRVEGLGEAWRFTRILFHLPAGKASSEPLSIWVMVSHRAVFTALIAILGMGLLQTLLRRVSERKLLREKAFSGSSLNGTDEEVRPEGVPERIALQAFPWLRWAELVWCLFVFLLSMVMLAGNTYNPFIYFRF